MPEYPGLLMVDVSRYQLPDMMDYSRLVEVDNVVAAAVRVSVSDYYLDPQTVVHAARWHEAGVPVIGYHVNRPGQPIDASIGNFKVGLDRARQAIAGFDWAGIVLDSELDSGQPPAVIRQDCYEHAVAFNEMHDVVFGYTRATWWDRYVGYSQWAPRLLKPWPAHYYWPWVKQPNMMSGWVHQGITWQAGAWQWSDKLKLSGYDNGRRDIDGDFISEGVLTLLRQDNPGPQPPQDKAIVNIDYDPDEVEVKLNE